MFEKYAEKIPNFNPSAKAKSGWQAADTVDISRRFIMTAKMFVRRTERNCTPDGTYSVPYTVHLWIVEHVQPLRTRLVPNKDRPRLFTINEEDVLTRLENSDPNTFQENDIVSVSFKIHYAIRARVWAVEFTPLEMVRVGHHGGVGEVDEEEEDYDPIEAGAVLRPDGVLDAIPDGVLDSIPEGVVDSIPDEWSAIPEPAVVGNSELKRKRQESCAADSTSKAARQASPSDMDVEIEEIQREPEGGKSVKEGAEVKAVRGRRAMVAKR
jgi:hypothetical protein